MAASDSSSGSRTIEGVLENRGAGAGCMTPWRVRKTPRDTMCSCREDSVIVKTGAKQTSVPSMILHHSSRVLLLKTSASLCFSFGQAARSI